MKKTTHRAFSNKRAPQLKYTQASETTSNNTYSQQTTRKNIFSVFFLIQIYNEYTESRSQIRTKIHRNI